MRLFSFAGWNRLEMLRGLAVAATVTVALAAGSGAAWAQASPELQRDLRGVSNAFQVVADDASRGAWAQADADYNTALDRLDAVRGPAAETGPTGVTVMNQIDGQLSNLEDALAGEDVARTRSVIGLIQAQLARLVPGLPRSISPPQVVELLLGWQSQLQAISLLADGAAWRDMRNEAIALADAADANGARLVRDLGPDAEAGVARVALMALRLRAAALSQSRTEIGPAIEVAQTTIRELLVMSGALPTPTPAAKAGAFHFVAGHAAAAVGQPVEVTLSAEDIPAAGLGGFDVRLRWSPGALRLDQVDWRPEIGEGTLTRNDTQGTVELRLPVAPRGPRGNADLAVLHFTVRSATVQTAAYLPAGELDALQRGVREASRLVKIGDLPKAGDALALPYYNLVLGRHRDDSLFAELDRFGLATALEASLYQALNLTTRAEVTDRIVVALDDLSSAFDLAMKGYMGRLADLPGVPIDIVFLSAADTTGQPLVAADSEPGLVIVPGAQLVNGQTLATSSTTETVGAAAPELAGAEATVEAISTLAAGGAMTGGVASAGPTAGSIDALVTPSAEDVSEARPSAAANRRPGPTGPPEFPRALVIALLAAFIFGLVAVLAAGREGTS